MIGDGRLEVDPLQAEGWFYKLESGKYTLGPRAVICFADHIAEKRKELVCCVCRQWVLLVSFY